MRVSKFDKPLTLTETLISKKAIGDSENSEIDSLLKAQRVKMYSRTRNLI